MENTIDITTLQTVELKALAYDLTLQLEQTKANLQLVNREIINRQSNPTPAPLPTK